MESKKNIVWLASFPKSGNTWLRLFLLNMFSDSMEPIDINTTYQIPSASSRAILDKYLGIDSADLSHDEIYSLRPRVYQMLSNESDETLYFKTHDAYKQNLDGVLLFPHEITKGAIYIIRNPLDVAISLAFHNNISFANSISNLNEQDYGLCLNNKKLYSQLPQQVSSWSNHVLSWINRSNIHIKVIRYEDMVTKPVETFSQILNFIELSYNKTKLIASIDNCSFNSLRSQEEKIGFNEKSMSSQFFFRSGQINNWKEYLNKEQIKILIDQHHVLMGKYGYLEDYSG